MAIDYLQAMLQAVPPTSTYGGNVGLQAALLNQAIRAKEANTLPNQLISSKTNSINKTAEQTRILLIVVLVIYVILVIRFVLKIIKQPTVLFFLF